MEQAEQGARRPLSPGPQSRPPSLAQALPPQCPPRPWSHAAFPAALAWGEDVPAECAEWWDWQRLEGFWPCFPGSPPHCLPPHGEEPLPEAPVSGTSPRPLYRAELERTRSGAGEASRPPAAWPRALPREGRAVRAEPRLRLVDSDPPAAEASSRPFSFRGNVLLRKRPPFTRAGQTGAPRVAHCVTASPPGPLRVRRSAVSSATPREAAAELTGPPCCSHTAACVPLSPSAPPWTAWVQGTLRLVFFFFLLSVISQTTYITAGTARWRPWTAAGCGRLWRADLEHTLGALTAVPAHLDGVLAHRSLFSFVQRHRRRAASGRSV